MSWPRAALLAALLLTAAVPAWAQTPVGVILGANTPHAKATARALEAELKKAGISAQLLTQRPSADTLAWANAARKFAAFDVELIVVIDAPVGLDALVGEADVPIVFAVPKHQTPKTRGKVTGVTWSVPLAAAMKYLETIKDFSTLGVVSAGKDASKKRAKAELDRLAAKFGYATVDLTVTSSAQAAGVSKTEATFVTESCVRTSCLKHTVAAAREAGVPTASITAGAEDGGVLLTLAADPLALGAAAGRVAAQVLKGKSAGSLEVTTVKKIAMVVNLKEAGAMGVKVPFDVLSAAGRVIK